MVKLGHFEVLRKKSSNIPRVVWAEESKNGPRFESWLSYDDVQTMSQLVTDGQSSCIKIIAITRGDDLRAGDERCHGCFDATDIYYCY